MLEIYDRLKNEVVGREVETKSIFVAMGPKKIPKRQDA
jgi:hypothetical protein